MLDLHEGILTEFAQFADIARAEFRTDRILRGLRGKCEAWNHFRTIYQRDRYRTDAANRARRIKSASDSRARRKARELAAKKAAA